ncbi:dTDP-4-dehydrorhamnose 3,5-epimerase [Caenimonas soli]|uniref:dTDP-4-dehydrorhamnose 3,5-epimerase n=1 Tax=Caenimonas soli TaxID=2735555 RepID=UPI0015543369|nr:dTDP-4-dehydrorhamnose 3,5-epimerase [Caenimonas soli]NPC55551.1 dTDP-4-dehydrorhamnose 3,5-epimerase [Caenimonas soli]
MIFTETRLKGAFILELERRDDERGFFARSWCQEEFLAHGLNPAIAQCNISFNRLKGTLRGMHYAAAPFEEAKLVRCTAGAAYDVIIDLRRDSPTYKQHVGEVLSAANYRMMYVPEGFAHGFQTLEDNTEIFYQMSQFYSPDHARGVRYDDPAFGIKWMIADPVMLDRDRTYPDFTG